MGRHVGMFVPWKVRSIISTVHINDHKPPHVQFAVLHKWFMDPETYKDEKWIHFHFAGQIKRLLSLTGLCTCPLPQKL